MNWFIKAFKNQAQFSIINLDIHPLSFSDTAINKFNLSLYYRLLNPVRDNWNTRAIKRKRKFKTDTKDIKLFTNIPRIIPPALAIDHFKRKLCT